MPMFRNLEGTLEDSFQVGNGNSAPILQRVSSTSRLRLPDLIRWLPSGNNQQGFLSASLPDGDLYVSQNNLTAVTSPTPASDNTQGYSVGSIWLEPTNNRAWICKDNSTGAAEWLLISPPEPTFGSQYQYADSSAPSSTTSVVFQNKLTLTTPSIPAGSYRLGYSYRWGLSQTNNQRFFIAQILADANQVYYHQQSTHAPENQHRTSGFVDLTYGSSGTHTYQVQWARLGTATPTATIQDVRLEFWRVS